MYHVYEYTTGVGYFFPNDLEPGEYFINGQSLLIHKSMSEQQILVSNSKSFRGHGRRKLAEAFENIKNNNYLISKRQKTNNMDTIDFHVDTSSPVVGGGASNGGQKCYSSFRETNMEPFFSSTCSYVSSDDDENFFLPISDYYSSEDMELLSINKNNVSTKHAAETISRSNDSDFDEMSLTGAHTPQRNSNVLTKNTFNYDDVSNSTPPQNPHHSKMQMKSYNGIETCFTSFNDKLDVTSKKELKMPGISSVFQSIFE
jgi:hypothetical protein